MSTHKHINDEQKVDTEVDRDSKQSRIDRIVLSKRRYQIWHHLVKNRMCQQQVADKLNISRQAVYKHVQSLETLGVIKPIDPNGNPKYYKATNSIPGTTWKQGKIENAVISKNAKKAVRRVGLPYKAVRDHKTGRFKGKRMPRGDGHYRDYDTLISQKGKRIPMLRVHSVSYTCTILNEPAEPVPWTKKKGPRGMEQWVLRHRFSNKKSEIPELRSLEITFMRQKTKGTDELIIYMPEKYLLETELKKAKDILEKYVWKARKWFQNKYKPYLGFPLEYRPMEIAREIDEPGLKRFVEEHGMVKVKTERGHAVVDESKKGFPEREFTSIEEVETDLHLAERVLRLESMIERLIVSQEKMIQSQERFMDMMGLRQEEDVKRAKDSIDRMIQ